MWFRKQSSGSCGKAAADFGPTTILGAYYLEAVAVAMSITELELLLTSCAILNVNLCRPTTISKHNRVANRVANRVVRVITCSQQF